MSFLPPRWVTFSQSEIVEHTYKIDVCQLNLATNLMCHSVFETYREEVSGLPESHLPGLDHVDGVLEGLLLRHLGAVDADALELEAGLQGGVCGKQKVKLQQ